MEGYDNPQTFLVFKLCEFHGKAEYNYSTCSLHLHSDILLQEFCSGQLEVGEQHVRFFLQLNYSIVSFSSSSNTNDFLVVSSNNVVTSAENPHDT